MATKRLLYQFRHSHFSEKARWALAFKGLAYEKVNLTRGPHARVTSRLGPDTTVPVLVDDGVAIQDSTKIIDYLEEHYPEPPLEPSDEGDRVKARKLEEELDELLGYHSRRFLYSILIHHPDVLKFVFLQGKGPLLRLLFPVIFRRMRPRMIERLELGPGATEESEKEIFRGLDLLEKQLDGGDYLVANTFTRADLTGAALLALVTWPKSYDLEFPPPEMIPPRLQSFLAIAREHAAFRWAQEMYARHR